MELWLGAHRSRMVAITRFDGRAQQEYSSWRICPAGEWAAADTGSTTTTPSWDTPFPSRCPTAKPAFGRSGTQQGMRDLNTLIDPCADPRVFPVDLAVDINNHGQIAVYGGHVVGFSPSSWLLTPYLPGDLNEDATTDCQDLAALLSNFGRSSSATYADGDLDCDTDVDLQDLAILLANFGQTLP